jgi:uncharacterized protein (DUF2267 family)
MTQVEFIQRVKEIGGFEHIADASAALRAVLSALGSAFDPSERRLVSESLPTSLREVLEGESTQVSDPSLSGLLARVQHSQGISLGRAKEHAQVVCRALAEVLPFEVILWIGGASRQPPPIERSTSGARAGALGGALRQPARGNQALERERYDAGAGARNTGDESFELSEHVERLSAARTA